FNYYYWIGMYDFKSERSWVWISDNRTVNMSYWVQWPENLSNDPCGYMFYVGRPLMSVENCASTPYYICMCQ
ncbi:C-type lectin BiL-like isoform X2, partial [Biomphalaria glabrata]